MCDGPIETVFIKRCVPLGMRGRLAGIGLHTGCKGIIGYSYYFDILEPSLQVVLVYSMLEKKNCRFWSEADAGYLLSGSNKVKLWRQ